MAGRYVEIPADRLVATLATIGTSVEQSGGSWGALHGFGNERVYYLRPPKVATEVRIFTSLSRHADAVRARGTDAVRLVVGARLHSTLAQDSFKPLQGGKRIYRTAPASLEGEARVDRFLDRLRDELREAYRVAVRTPRCPGCQSAGRVGVLISRNSALGSFLGCGNYPLCTYTRNIDATAGDRP